MKRSSTFLLATLAAVALAACGPRRTDTTTTGGSETGAAGTAGTTGRAYDTTSTTGKMGDTINAKTDSTAR